MRVVICGGGVIGASVAYFLSRRGVDVIVVERRGVACAASGKAGAFLARSPQVVRSEAFSLEQSLAQTLAVYQDVLQTHREDPPR